MHFGCLLWSFRSFGVSFFFFFLIAQHCSFGKMSSDMFILFFSLVMVSFTCTVISLDFPNMESSSEWLQNAFITIRINSRCLICLICDEIITSHESVYWQIIQLIGTLFKNCKLLMEHFCQTPWIKSKTLQFNHILIVWCILGSVQRQNYKKNVIAHMDLIVNLRTNPTLIQL